MTVRLRPCALAAYRARSASWMRPSGLPACSSRSAMPRLAVMSRSRPVRVMAAIAVRGGGRRGGGGGGGAGGGGGVGSGGRRGGGGGRLGQQDEELLAAEPARE